MSSKNILVISSACHTSINRSVYKKMYSMGHNVTIIIPQKTKFNNVFRSPDPIEPDDPPIIFLKTIFSFNPRLQLYNGLIQKLILTKPEIVLLDLDPLCLQAFILGILCKINKIKFFAISCENIPINFLESVKRRGLFSTPALLVKLFLKLTNKKLLTGVFTINNEGTEIYKDFGFNNVIKIPLGFDSKHFKIDPALRKNIKLQYDFKGITIAYFGRFVYEKGIHILINLLSALKEFEWILVMDEFKDYKTNYITDIKSSINSNSLQSRVKFINPNHKEIGPFINAIDKVIVPSLSTNTWVKQYGRIIPEALACGKLIIASNSGAIPMLFNNHGILFKEGDTNGLTKILKNIFINNKFISNVNEFDLSDYAYKKLSI